jgi:hypothetical protein
VDKGYRSNAESVMSITEWYDADQWLTELRRRHWTLHFFGDRAEPHIIGAVWQWEDCADVAILRGHDRAVAYRVPTTWDTDVFAPLWVYWWYAHSAAWALRAVLTLEPPTGPAELNRMIPAPPICRVGLDERRPVTIRPT